MRISIRQENKKDFQAVFNLVESAFKNEIFSDLREQFLVERLRNSLSFIPELSLIAELDSQVVGHIFLTKIKIVNDKHSCNSLALAPVAVLPEFQKRGIGSQLIESAHKKAIELGHRSIALLGHKNYYPKFGYLPADQFGIEFPFDVPNENCMVLELIENGLNGVNGKIEYQREFFE